MSLPSWVHYHGATNPDDLCRQWFPSAQGLISLSHHAEGRPQVMLEAMAAGLPIIASSIPAHEDLIADGDTGWICRRPGDVGMALATLDDHVANLEMGQRAKAWVQTRIGTWDDCAARYANIYSELIGAAP